jgi:hypothetical protein
MRTGTSVEGLSMIVLRLRVLLLVSGVLLLGVAAAGAVWYVTRPPAPPPVASADPAAVEEDDAGDGPTLAAEEREFLWDVEHHGNVLNAEGFAALAQALRQGDGAALLAMLAPNFTGHAPDQPFEAAIQSDVAQVTRTQDAGQTPCSLTREQFLARLLEFRRLFVEQPPKVKLLVMTLLPKVREEREGAWTGRAQLRLHGETQAGQPAEVVVLLDCEVARPTKERLRQPGWLRSARWQQNLVARASHYLMGDVARQRGIDAALFHDNWREDPRSSSSLLVATGGVFLCDFDRDGWVDVLITDVNRYALYRGTAGGVFRDVTEEYGLARLPSNRNALSGVACWIDIDGDGWEDLILGERVYRNVSGKNFLDQTPWATMKLPEDTISLVVADYDRDGKLDLYATRTGTGRAASWLEGTSGADAGNFLFRNRGNWVFEDVTEASGTSGGRRSTFTAAWLDANNDGWPDLHVINEFGNGVLLVNQGDGRFLPHSLGDGPRDFGTMGVAAGDIDNDGHIDLYCANMYSKAGTRVIGNLKPGAYPDDIMAVLRRFVAGSELHLNKDVTERHGVRSLRFEPAGKKMQVAAVGWAYGPALVDLDNDGWLDIYGTAGHISRDRDKPDG